MEKLSVRNLYKMNFDRKSLLFCLLITFAIGLTAHAYAFLNLTISHDSINEFILLSNCGWQISLGRFMNPILRFFMGDYIILPWHDGLCGLLFTGLAVYLTAQILELTRKPQLVLLAGIFTVNVTVTASIASYMAEYPGFMMSLFFAVCAACIWHACAKAQTFQFLPAGAVFIAVSMGFYQSYLSVTVLLIMLPCMMMLLNGKKFRPVIKDGMAGIFMILSGGVLYLACVKLMCTLTGARLAADRPNSLANLWLKLDGIPHRILGGYARFLYAFLLPCESTSITSLKNVPALSAATAVLYVIAFCNGILLLSCAVMLFYLARKRMAVSGAAEKLLLFTLVLLMPAAMMLTYIMSGVSDDINHYALFLFYVFCLLLAGKLKEEPERTERLSIGSRLTNAAVLSILCIVLIHHIQVANTCYVVKNLERNATISTMTRVLAGIEAQEGYVTGQTEVAFIGESPRETFAGVKGAENVKTITGMEGNSQITFQGVYDSFFRIVLQYPIVTCDSDKLKELEAAAQVQSMPVFPNEGSVITLDGIVVVKMK